MTTRSSTALGLSLAAGALLLPAQQGMAGETAGARIEIAQAQPAPQQPDPKQKAQAAEAERRAKAEAARQQAERARQQADQARQQAERARQQAAEQARQQQEAQRKARQDQQRKDDEARRAKAEQDRTRIQAERDKAQAERRKEEEARRAKAEQDRARFQAERDKAQTERRKEDEARRLNAEQERQKAQTERAKAQTDRRREDDARRAKAEQERLKAQDDRKKADDLRAGARPPASADTGRPQVKDGSRAQEPAKGEAGRRDGAPASGPATAQPGSTRAPGAAPTTNFIGKGVAIRDNLKLQDVKSQRQERREGNTTIIREPGGRQIVRESNRAVIVNNDLSRLRFNARDVQTRSGSGGTRVTTVVKPNGFTVITTEDAQGRVLRRSRRDPSGREHVFYQNRSRPSGWTIAAVAVAVAIPTILIARHLYEVDAREARYDDYYTAFRAEPVSRLDRVYSLDEVRYNYSLRAHMRSVDVNTITFQSGSWDIDPSQFRKLDDIARAIDDVLRDNPDEVFLIEGHTDAVGTPEDNLTLSDRRAESVARVLSEEFGIPPENLTTQGYGEEFLKVPTEGPEPRNRRVVIRRITPLVSENYRR